MSPLKNLSLNARFIMWFLIIAMVPIVIGNTVIIVMTQRIITNEILDEIDALGSAVSTSVVNEFDGHIQQMEALSLNNAFTSEINEASEEAVFREALQRATAEFPDFHELVLLDSEGKVITAAGDIEVEEDMSSEQYFTTPLATKDHYIRSIELSEALNIHEYIISVPIIKGGNVPYVLVGYVSAERLGESLINLAERLGETGDVYLVNEDRYLITSSRTEGEDVILKDQYEAQHITDCLNGIESNSVAVDFHGEDVYGSYRHNKFNELTGLNWCIVTEKHQSEVEQPLNTLIYMSIGIAVLLAGGIGVAAYFISKSLTQDIRRPIQSSVNQIFETIAELSASTTDTSSAAQQNASIAQQLASGATQQSNQAESISKSISSMSAAMQQISASVQEATSSASQSSQLVQNNGEKSERINEMVVAITSISEQTNLLALNAAIEAARAGEAGRGFAVVADEVRKLAESSGSSAKEIKEIVQVTGDSMISTVTSIQLVSKKIQDVSEGIQNIATSVQDISKTIDSIAQVSEQNASGAQQLSASTQQQSAANQQIAAASQQLRSLAEELLSVTDAKRVETDTPKNQEKESGKEKEKEKENEMKS